MLISMDTGKKVKRIPHRVDYERWISRLTTQELDDIRAELTRRITGGEVHTSSWIPGSDWRGTVFQPIYERACNKDERAAALCFGLILWVLMMDRPDRWSYGRYEKNGIPIEGLTYFRLDG
ncbi:MAG: hypothetical protein HY700_16885 [Gemmatimonadetes bacterium]|nr:hypothetical protein [Gemmatimonadota bacterium]